MASSSEYGNHSVRIAMDQCKKPSQAILDNKSENSKPDVRARKDTRNKDTAPKATQLLVTDDSKPVISDINLCGSATRVVLRPPGCKF